MTVYTAPTRNSPNRTSSVRKSHLNRAAGRWRRIALAATGTVGASLLVTGSASALDYNYIPANQGGFNLSTSWVEGVSPFSPTADLDARLFFGPSAGNYIAFNDVGNFTTNQINVTNTSAGNTVSFRGAGDMTFAGINAGMFISGGSVDLFDGGQGPNLTTVGPARIENSGDGTLNIGVTKYGDGPTTFAVTGSGFIVFPETPLAPIIATANTVINLENTGTGEIRIGGFGGTSGGFGTGGIGTVNVSGPGIIKAVNTTSDLFSGTQVLNVNAGATFDFANNPEGMGGISGTGNITLGTAGLTLSLGGDRSFGGRLSGTGNISHTGQGVFTLSGEINPLIGATNAWTGSMTVTVGTLSLGNQNQTIGGLIGGNQYGTLPIGDKTLTLIGTNVNRIWTGAITGTGSVVINTQGQQALIGENTYTGPTTVIAGTLTVPYSTLVSSSATTVAAGARLNVLVPTTATWNVPVTNAGTLNKDGNGTLTFNNSARGMNLTSFGITRGAVVIDKSTDNGTVLAANPSLAITTGQLTLIGNAAADSTQNFAATTLAGGARVTVRSGQDRNATVTLGAITRQQNFGATLDVSLSNTGTGVASVTTTSNNIGTGAAAIVGGYATVNGSSWAVSGTGAGPFAISALPAGGYTNNAAWSATTNSDVSGTFSPTTGSSVQTVRFNTAGAATLRLTGANTVTAGGMLVTAAVGASNVSITNAAAGATLTAAANNDLVVHQYNTAGLLTINTVISNTVGTPVVRTAQLTGTAGSFQTITLDTAGIPIGALVTGTNFSATANARVVSIDSPNTATLAYFAGSITNNATSDLTTGPVTVTFTPQTNLVKSGPGTLVLNAANTFRGVVVLNEGVLRAAGPTILGNNTSAGSSSLLFNGGTLEITANNSSGASLQPWTVGPAGGTLNIAANATVTKQGNTFFGAGDLRLTGPGTLSVGTDLSGFTGRLLVDAGTIRLTSNQIRNALGVTIGNGAQFLLNDTTSGPFNLGAGASLVLNGNGPNNSGAWYHDLAEAGSVDGPDFNSPVILASTARFSQINRNADVSTDRFPYPISGPGSLIKSGTGVMILANASNTYGGTNGSTIITAGTFRNGILNALPTATTLQFGEAGSNTSGIYDLSSYSQTVAGLLTAGNGTAHQIINTTNDNSTAVLTVNYNGATAQTFAGQIGGASASNSKINLVKTGTGTLNLLGSTTYTGSATVNQGTLRVTDSSVARAYAVADGATLAIANLSGLTLDATALTLGSAGTSNISFEFLGANPTSGAISVASDGLTLNGNINVSISSVAGLGLGQFTLIKYAGSIQGLGFAAFNPISLPNRGLGSLVNNVANSSIDINVTALDFIKWNGNVSGDWNINTTSNFRLNSNASATTYLDAPSPDKVVFDETATGTRIINLTTTVKPSSVDFAGPLDYTLAGTGKLSGGTGLTKSGAGTLQLSTDNDNTGLTAITGGTLIVGNGATSGALGSGNVTNNGQLTFNRTDNVTFAPNITGTGSLTKSGGNTLTLTGSLVLDGNVTLGGGVLSVVSGSVGGNVSGAGTITKSGAGTFTFAGDVATASPTLLNGGTIQIGNGGITGTLSSDVSSASGTLVVFNRTDASTSAAAITGGGGLTVVSGSVKLTGSVDYAGRTTLNSSTLEIASATDTTFQLPLSGNADAVLIKSGEGTLSLVNNNNPFVGSVIVNGGTVRLADFGFGGDLSATSITINNGGRFLFGQGGIVGENPDFPATTNIIANTGGTFEIRIGEDAGSIRLDGGTFFLNGANFNITNTSGPWLGVDARSGTFTSTGNFDIGASAAAITAGAALNKTTSGTVTVTGGVDFAATLPINILEGTIAADSASWGVSTGTGVVTLGQGSTPASFQLTNGASANSARPLVIGSTASAIDVAVAAGTATFSGGSSGTGTLTKTGPGRLVLSGVSTFTGNLAVAGGNLTVQTSLRSTATTVTVDGVGSSATFSAPVNATTNVITAEIDTMTVGVGAAAQVALTARPASKSRVFVANSVSLLGSLDLTNNDAVLHQMSESAVRGLVGSWWNNGARNGIGLASSAASLDAFTTLAVLSNDLGGGTSRFSEFSGLGVSASDTLVKYTYLGDTNLDGLVDTTDIGAVVRGIRLGLSGWANGDTNYDNVVNGLDYANVIAAFNYQGAALLSGTGLAIGDGSTPTGGQIPEPSALGLLAVPAMLLGRRRR